METQTQGFVPPEQFNIADHFLDARVREGRGDRIAVRTTERNWTYREIRDLSNQAANLLEQAGCLAEQRVLIALPDGPLYLAVLFGALKIGAVVVMVNPHLRPDQIAALLDYTRGTVVITHEETRAAFETAAKGARFLRRMIIAGNPEFDATLSACSTERALYPTHRDDPAIWLFSGGTSGRPKAVVQTHRSYANTTACYAPHVVGYREDDITLAVPKLFFGYALGAAVFFPFSVGASTVLFPERATPDSLFEQIERHRPTILINVPTMVAQMVAAPDAAARDVSSVRLATSAGEALPVELYARWKKMFGVELLDGIGTAEMWHIFLSNRPGDVKPGTLGKPVPGFDVRVCDENGREVPPGEVGYLWVRGDSRAIAYWQLMDETKRAFRGEWVVSEDMMRVDEDGYFVYCGRADDMLKVSGKWLSPQEVENCLLQHPSVRECAVVGVSVDGLTVPYAYVVLDSGADAGDAGGENLAALQSFVRERMESYKCPRSVVRMDVLPRTHLGKVDRGALRRQA